MPVPGELWLNPDDLYVYEWHAGLESWAQTVYWVTQHTSPDGLQFYTIMDYEIGESEDGRWCIYRESSVRHLAGTRRHALGWVIKDMRNRGVYPQVKPQPAIPDDYGQW